MLTCHRVDVPSLELVRGAFNLQSSQDIQSVCDSFAQKRKDDSNFVRGKYVCAGKLDHPSGEGTDPGKSKDDSGSAAPQSSLALMSVVALAMSFFAFL